MRTLKFIVKGQIIEKDPNCDFSNLVPGTEGYLRAQFSFSPEWHGCVKVAGFYSPLGIEYDPQILYADNSCMIPADALKLKRFKVCVLGKNDHVKLVTDKETVEQNGGKE